jgi:hypothetical protein
VENLLTLSFEKACLNVRKTIESPQHHAYLGVVEARVLIRPKGLELFDGHFSFKRGGWEFRLFNQTV